MHGFFIAMASDRQLPVSCTSVYWFCNMHKSHQLIVLTPGFPGSEEDSSCIPALQDLVLAWKQSYPDAVINIISFQYPHSSKKYLWHGIRVYAAGGGDRKGMYRLSTWMNVLFHIWRLKKREEVYLISYFLTEAACIGRVYARISGIPQIAIAAGQDVFAANRYLLKLSQGNLPVVVFNEKMNEALIASAGRPATAVIPMGMHHVTSVSNDPSIRPIDILAVGSLIPVKRTGLAIQLIARLRDTFSRLRVEIIGDGEERFPLKQMTEALQLTSQVSFTGQLPREAVHEKMKGAKILLHTSSSEGQSTVISEALQHGLYVVCFDVGRITDHRKIRVCQDELEMLHELSKILADPAPDFRAVELPDISDTVLAYSNLFNHLRTSV